MATERQWDAVPPVLLTADGTTEGVLQVADTAGFYFGMQCSLQNNTSLQLTVYVKMVVDSTTMYVGATKGGLDHSIDLSAFTIATASTISAAAQNKSTVPMEGKLLATYETDPVNAWRTKAVDAYGDGYTATNPLPVSGTFSPTPGTIPTEWTNIDLTYDSNNNIIEAQYYLGATLEQTLTMTYDSNNNLLTVTAAHAEG